MAELTSSVSEVEVGRTTLVALLAEYTLLTTALARNLEQICQGVLFLKNILPDHTRFRAIQLYRIDKQDIRYRRRHVHLCIDRTASRCSFLYIRSRHSHTSTAD